MDPNAIVQRGQHCSEGPGMAIEHGQREMDPNAILQHAVQREAARVPRHGIVTGTRERRTAAGRWPLAAARAGGSTGIQL